MPSLETHFAAPMPLRTTTPLSLRARASGTARSTYPSCRSCHTTGSPTMRFRLVSMPSSPFHRRTAMLPDRGKHAANNACQNRNSKQRHAIFSTAVLVNSTGRKCMQCTGCAGWRFLSFQPHPKRCRFRLEFPDIGWMRPPASEGKARAGSSNERTARGNPLAKTKRRYPDYAKRPLSTKDASRRWRCFWR